MTENANHPPMRREIAEHIRAGLRQLPAAVDHNGVSPAERAERAARATTPDTTPDTEN